MRTHSAGDLALLPAVIDAYVPAELVPRLKRLRQDHPEVKIVKRAPWEATVPEPDGERTIVRWELRDLLDRLDELLTVVPDDAGVTG
jgi:hypothetical protein